ncbi:probable palmitoyltransferase ZDHHC24 [Scaptodrosophila lebanonensis]|uniref:Palmitoyltransferase n=1 Tax=Drosophila lebanonensis TaxID=7225 RepID=A0A6J2UBS8_DROLE|nr:probable palmitoyltransferase ZDHHC24 [Scaptodrosophila lebanonensis]
MNIRKNVLPRRLVDWLCFLTIGIFLPIIFIFEMVIVLPAFHEPGGFFHTFTLLMGIFLVFNIKGNMIACMMVDTSVNYMHLQPPTEPIELEKWIHCATCDKLAPPRSWHCKSCGVCILKRDHHCLFMGCCIGHYNHRYFLCFIVYLFLGALYALVYNSIYIWILNGAVFSRWLTALKLICPMLMLVSGPFSSNMYLLFYSLNVLALLYPTLLLGYMGPLVLGGRVCHERGKTFKYNYGIWQNLRNIFGQRIFAVWLSPLITSELTHDGINWQTDLPKDAPKNK